MKCNKHTSIEATAHCLVCNIPLCDDCIVNNDKSIPQCANCASFKTMADGGKAQDIQTEKRRDQESKEKEISARGKEKKKLGLELSIIVVGLAFIAFQYASFYKPQDYSPIDKTDVVGITDYCLFNLLEISDLLLKGLLPGDEYRCPLTNTPYLVTHEHDDIIVSEPNPEYHGFSTMSVSKNNPEPLLIYNPDFDDTYDDL